ncbi:nodulation protein NfeD [Salinisphaera sp. PC39]|uniref:NfeD family protein n=1 Tax=Salinisphaera sp. PC39 TaxID=1304156 RepID=UPI00333EA84E
MHDGHGRLRRLIRHALAAACLAVLPATTGLAAGAAHVLAITGPIGPATQGYVERGIEAAESEGAELVLLRIDTPGGLDQAMRGIVKAVLAARVPVVGYVAPSGARAASAGTYILYATHIAAMAPATNLGSATPVSIGGGGGPFGGGGGGEGKPPADGDAGNTGEEPVADNETAMRRKVVNDAVAYIRGLAERRGRNADWAEKAVREGASLSAGEAAERDVIDLVAESTPALLAAIDGRTVTVAGEDVTLAASDLALIEREPDWRMKLLAVITNPTVAYILMMIGIYGLILEGYNPGSFVPGVTGAICLLLALFAFQILPVNFAGLALIGLGVALMVAEAFAPSFGILGLGGVAAFVFGSIMLMDTGVPGYQVPLAIIGATATASAIVLFLIVYLFMRSRARRVATGSEGMVGAVGEALEDFDGRGRVFVHGENWRATADTPVRRGQRVRVTAVSGLTVTVVPAE